MEFERAKMSASQLKLSPRGKDMKMRITDAALSLFANYGFDGVSTSDVADMVGVTQPNIHYYFNTKEDLWKSAVLCLSERAERSARTVGNPNLLEGLEPLSALKVLSSSLHKVSREVPELGKVIILEGVAGGARLDWLVETVFRDSYARYRALIERCIELKLIKPYRPHQVLFLLHSAAVSYYNLSPLVEAAFDANPMDEDVSDDFCDLYLDVLFAGLKLEDNS